MNLLQHTRIGGGEPSAGAAQRGRTPLLPLRGRWRTELETLVQRIYLTPGARAPRVLTLGAPHPLVGAGRVCSHVADLLASCVGHRVCLIENTAGESVSETLGLPSRIGWCDLLDDSGVDARTAVAQAAETNLWVIPAGARRRRRSRPADAAPADAVKRRIDELRDLFDFVVIDGTGDMLRLSGCSDAVAILVQEYVTASHAARNLKNECEARGASVLGVVFVHKAQ